MTKGVTFSIHYLDDFLTIGPASSNVCQHNLDILMQTCNELGIPLAEDKLEGPSTCITFLGIVIDTSKSEIRLPEEKLQRTRQEVASWIGKNKATKREILSLVRRSTPTRYQGGKTRKIICLSHVCSSGQSKGTRLLHKTRPGIQVRPGLVAYLSSWLEWP